MMSRRNRLDLLSLSRRSLLAAGAGLAGAGMLSRDALARLLQEGSQKTGVDPNKWNPETIRQLAGTIEVDTAAEVHAVVPAETSGEVSYWNVGPTDASPQI